MHCTRFLSVHAHYKKKPNSALLVISHCTGRLSLRAGAQILCRQKVWDRGRLVGSFTGCCAHGGCKRGMIGTEWAMSCPGCMSRRRKLYSHFVRGSVGMAKFKHLLIFPEIHLGAVLESGLRQTRRYGLLKTCIC